MTRMLYADACGGASTWRLVQVQADGPFGMQIQWSAAQGAGFSAHMTGGRSLRTSIFATSITIDVWNLYTHDNAVSVSISDAYVPTRNQFVAQLASLHAAPLVGVRLPVPPFASLVRADIDDPTLYAASFLAGYAGDASKRVELRLSEQPIDGTPVAGLQEIEAYAPAGVAGRVVWQLSL